MSVPIDPAREEHTWLMGCMFVVSWGHHRKGAKLVVIRMRLYFRFTAIRRRYVFGNYGIVVVLRFLLHARCIDLATTRARDLGWRNGAVFGVVPALGLNESEGFPQICGSLEHRKRRVIGGWSRVHTQSLVVESILVHRGVRYTLKKRFKKIQEMEGSKTL